ncbi:aminopeptidase [Flavobacterium sp. RHBU_24]|uniref:aminopeptidase n=1 Tax=Flavobacterium sp. RHBU_24 TaxID=3391185 RepID=UPI003984EFB5
MKISYRVLCTFLMFVCCATFAQHKNNITARLDGSAKVMSVQQEITYLNSSTDTLNHIILNDWNNAYSAKTTPLAKRFTDEFIKAFHLAKEEDRGHTDISLLKDQNNRMLEWHRPEGHPDLVYVQLKNPVYPGKSFSISINYNVKLPNERFTKFGFDDKTGNFNLRDWYLAPARYENGFVQYSNENLDDSALAPADYTFNLTFPPQYKVYSDLKKVIEIPFDNFNTIEFTGTNRPGFSLVLEEQDNMEVFKFPSATICSSMKDNRVSDIQRAVLVDKIAQFVANNLGKYPSESILVTQADYDRNPVYGLSQLPSFIRPFPDSFTYELRFLKTFLNAYLRGTLKLDPRKDNWVYDGLQMELITKYLQENHPTEKMMGNLGTWKLLKGHHIFNIGLNQQYNYFYLLMARKNLDQPIGNPQDTFIKFNEQIAGKYKAGLAFNYLDDYLGKDIVINSIKEFYSQNMASAGVNRNDFELALARNAKKDISWFFNAVIDTRDLIDYKIGNVEKTKDSLTVTLKNVTGTPVPVSLYGVKKGSNVFKMYVDGFKKDSTFTIARQDADRLILNRDEIMPEYNPRNNQKPLNNFFPNKRPYKFTFFQDIEDPAYNQVFYVPSFSYNLYDGLSPGIRFHNKSLLEKPFIFDINTLYSTNTGEATGSASLFFNQYIREGALYNIRYFLSGNTYHYAPDARYYKFTPSIQFRIRPDDFRKNEKQYLNIRQVMVRREKSDYVAQNTHADSYSIFNGRYSKVNSNISRHINFYTDVQVANSFGKLSGEWQFRRLFNDNRQVNLRLFAGMFMYNDTGSSDFFSFGLDRAADYSFDYNYYGRSETSGLFSQQFIMADGGFKSMLKNRFANQWMTTANASFNVWNWIELYGDAGLMKSKYNSTEFVYDSGVRLNLVTDYFELYFPLYSSNGFEPGQDNYGQKIRFVVTLSPGALIGLFTRKWL